MNRSQQMIPSVPTPSSSRKARCTSPRRGVTLTEVLIATMIMGIGLVSLATLFPISVHRSIRATQLTQATILKQNVEQYLDVSGALTPANVGAEPTGSAIDVVVVDPLGVALNGAAFRGTFGNDGTAPVMGAPARFAHRPGTVTPLTATELRDIAHFSENWSEILTDIPDAVTDGGDATTPGEVTFAPAIDLTDLSVRTTTGPGVTNLPSRVVLIEDSDAGREVVVANVTGVDATDSNKIFFDANILFPAGFSPTSARVETQDNKFSWFATLRRRAGGMIVNVVVVFNRSFQTEDEYIFSNDGDPVFNIGNNKAYLEFDGEPTPRLINSGYIFDPANGYWYRIQDYTIDEDNSRAEITLEDNARATSGGAMVIRGVVEVFLYQR